MLLANPISWILVGIIAGILAKVILPGRDPGGLLLTPIVGMGGAFVGGIVFGLIGGAGFTGFNLWSILVATVGAVILLFVYRLFAGRKTV
ncbi:GlsB/YeaQ/YmgE family stress response membrane protein [soil metagenome]